MDTEIKLLAIKNAKTVHVDTYGSTALKRISKFRARYIVRNYVCVVSGVKGHVLIIREF